METTNHTRPKWTLERLLAASALLAVSTIGFMHLSEWWFIAFVEWCHKMGDLWNQL
jgi:hypothetical protein